MIICGLVNMEPAVVTNSSSFDRGFSNLFLVLDIANNHKKIGIIPGKLPDVVLANVEVGMLNKLFVVLYARSQAILLRKTF